jgi:hypothetical protein
MNNRVLRLLVHGALGLLFFAALGMLGYGNFAAGMPLGMVLLNSLLLAIPLFLLFGGLGLLFEAMLHRREGEMGPRITRVLYFAPRVAAFLIALFIGLFALDVFDMPGGFWQKLGGFLIHAAPALVLLVLAGLAWRWSWLGALVFGLAAVGFLLMAVIGSAFAAGNLMLFVLPLAAVAALFFVNWRWRLHPAH